MGSSCKCKLFLPHRLVENTEVFIIRLRRSGKVKGSDIGIHSPGLHSSFSYYSALRLVNAALSSSNSCKLAAAQSMLGSFRYTSWSPRTKAGCLVGSWRSVCACVRGRFFAWFAAELSVMFDCVRLLLARHGKCKPRSSIDGTWQPASDFITF